ncbi:MAG: hypothetical protein G01um101456_542, partial [Parcubacteria group bacterium Gr01-1014_56]
GISTALGFVALEKRTRGKKASLWEKTTSVLNVVFLLCVAEYLTEQGFERLREPGIVYGWSLLVVATIGAAANFTQMRLMHTLSHKAHEHGSTKTGQVFHYFSDFLASIAVIVGSIAVLLGFPLGDTIASFVVAFAILCLVAILVLEMKHEWFHNHDH